MFCCFLFIARVVMRFFGIHILSPFHASMLMPRKLEFVKFLVGTCMHLLLYLLSKLLGQFWNVGCVRELYVARLLHDFPFLERFPFRCITITILLLLCLHVFSFAMNSFFVCFCFFITIFFRRIFQTEVF